MSRMKQVALLAAGCQPWNTDVCAASGDRFAYCATLAIYIYQYDKHSNEFKLHSIMSEHKKTITAISWSVSDEDLILSASADRCVIVWNVPKQYVVGRLIQIKAIPNCVGWIPHQINMVSFIYDRGPLVMWNYSIPSANSLVTHKEAQSFSSNITQFRWHPTKPGKIAIGHTRGSISIFCPGIRYHKNVLAPIDLDDDDEDPVLDMDWDPLSTDYLLIANADYGIRMIDTNEMITVTRFILPSAAASVSTLAWVPNAPGIFITGDKNVGISRVWNVSKETPLENIRLKNSGFHALHVFASSKKDEIGSLPINGQMSPKASDGVKVPLPPAHAVCTFRDGGIGLYDLNKRKWNFLRDEGHIETIFDCKFKSDDPDVLATASFDGTIKLWDVTSMKSIDCSPGNEGIIYSISWAPADLNCIVAATSKQGVFIWDIAKGKIIKRFQEHGRHSVFCVVWCRRDAKRIASCGADGFCIIRQVDGTLIQKYKHPAPIFGCDWSPDNKDMLATGCEDGNVRVYYLITNTDKPLKIFSGHQSKVFHVKWCPLKEGLLCSGSDDGTIRIWDYTLGTCKNVLIGHTNPVRGLLWSTEIPYLLVSGSWDYSIRIWDTRDGACIDSVLDHGADVYGLTSHPSRPFVLASCSRDSTVRLWSITSIIQPLEINIIAKRPWTEIIATPDQSLSQGTAPLLTGRVSKELKLQTEEKPGNTYHHALKTFSKFFMHPVGTDNLWNLVSVILGGDDSMLPDSYSKGIVHVRHITKYKVSEAHNLELTRTSKFGGRIGSKTRQESLKEAADIHIKLGNIQRYCELMVELGRWEKAIAVAPGVSLDYWKALTARYSDYLSDNEYGDQAVPYCVCTGNTKKIVDFFITNGQLHNAFLMAQVACEGTLDLPHLNQSKQQSCLNGYRDNGDSDNSQQESLLHKCSEDLAEWHFSNGHCIEAACCHLAVGDCQKAVSKLIRGNELELAVSVGTVLGKTPELTSIGIEYLALRCEKIGRGDLSVRLLKMIPNGQQDALIRLCARCGGSMSEIDSLHQQAGLPSLEDCLQEAEKLKNEDDVLKCVQYYIISSQPEMALEIGLKFIIDKLCKDDWLLNDVYPMMSLLGCIRTDSIQHHAVAKQKSSLLILGAYLGAFEAMRRQYFSIVVSLFSNARFVMSREPHDVPLTNDHIQLAIEAWHAHHLDQPKDQHTTQYHPTEAQSKMYKDLKHRAGTETWLVGVGTDCVSGSHLPTHSDIHISYLTNRRIDGQAFFLEDGRSVISLSEALMWAKVNPFSPLASGEKINPF